MSIIARADQAVQTDRHNPGALVVARLVAGTPTDTATINALSEPWREIAHGIITTKNGAGAAAAFLKVIAGRPDEVQLRAAVFAQNPADKPNISTPAGPLVMSAAELLHKTFAPLRQIVPHVLNEGSIILAGRPKVGKGRIALSFAVSVAAGGRALGRIPVEKGSVLYIGMEDGERRLQERLQDLLQGESPPDSLDIATEWPRLNEGGLSLIGGWLDAHPDARLVVIDTLKRVRPLEQRGASLYGQDYDAVAGLTDLSHKYRVCILIIHHTRKGDSDDPIELISGSLGLSGAVDGALVLKCGQGQEQGAINGRHREGEVQLTVQRDYDFGSWVLVGEPGQRPLTPDRAKAVQAIREAGRPLTPTEASERLGKKPNAVQFLFWKMAQAGQLRALGDGRYDLPKPTNGAKDTNGPNVANDAKEGSLSSGGRDASGISSLSGLSGFSQGVLE